jgi:MoaA/NifB/PqqE/SkfB family radical SAM enzyme
MDILDHMGVGVLSITGGEPLLRADIFDIIRYAKEVGFTVQITSNGLQPQKIYEKLLNTGIDRIAISLDRIHGEDIPYSHNSERIIKTIDYLITHKSNSLVTVSTVLHTENKSDVDEVIKFCKLRRMNVFVQPVVTGKGYFRVDRKETLDGYVKSDDLLSPSYFTEAAEEYIKKGRLLWNCLAGQLFFDIKPNGDFWICQDFPTKLNILDPAFTTLWKQYDFQLARKQCTDGCIYSCYYIVQKGSELVNISETIKTYRKLR